MVKNVAIPLLFAATLLCTNAWAEKPKPAAETALGSETASESFVRHGLQSTLRKKGIRFSGDIYIDTGYEKSERKLESEPNEEFWLQEGRFMLQTTPTWSNGRYFFKAQAQFLAHVNEIRGQEFIDTDDAWVKFGFWDTWDVQIGRYEAWEVYHKGQGLERDTLEDLGAYDGPDIYEVNYAYYRQDGFGSAAAHYYPLSWLRFELSGVFGNELKLNTIGVRPAAILDFDWLKVKLAGEWRKAKSQEEGKKQWDEKRGVGGSLQFFFDDPEYFMPVQFGVNAAFGLVDKVGTFGKVDERGSVDTLSMGGFVNLGAGTASIGLGYNHTIQGDRQENDQSGKVGNFVHQQAFASVKHPVFVPQATAKLVFAYARTNLKPAFDNHRINEMYSVRLRMLYQF